MAASDVTANAAFTALTAGVNFDLPDVDLEDSDFQTPPGSGPLYEPITRLANSDLTEIQIEGSGTFDVLMRAFKLHLLEEYAKGRITGSEYSKAYIALTESSMAQAVQFLLAKDTAYWQAIGAQLQAQTAQVQLITARVDLETAKAQLAQMRMEAQRVRADYALTKMKLATESAGYDIATYNLGNILPTQKDLLTEQKEAARAQTLDTRTDTTPVTGVMGKQKELVAQQITSYKRDAETKVAKLFTDAWITMKTIDEGLLPPTNFENASLNSVLGTLKTNNALGS